MSRYTFEHIHIRSPNPEATAQFYERMFGAEVIRGIIHEGKPKIDLKLGGMNIFIADESENKDINSSSVHPHLGLDHFGLRVNNIDELVADLKSKGVVFTKEPVTPVPGIRIAFLRGPEDVSIELIDRDAK